MEQRLKFCRWLWDQSDPETFVLKDIYRQMIFFFNQASHRKSDGTWSLTSPNGIVEYNYRNDEKVVIFIAIVNGNLPVVHAFMEENGRRDIVIGDC